MSTLFNKDNDDILRELYQSPVKDYVVTFYYHERNKPKELKKLEFVQHDSSPYFPRINRFFEFCLAHMKPKYKFVDYDATMEKIDVKNGIELNGQESLVVYTAAPSDFSNHVKRDIIQGPSVWMPSSLDEEGNRIRQWVHNFSVHGSSDREYGPDIVNVKIPGALKFSKIRSVPSMMYVDTIDTRTNDDALLTVKSVVYYEISDINKLLDNTYDFTADLINSLSACTNQFVSTRSFNSFKDDIYELNSLDRYSILVDKGQEIGINVTKVVCNGYMAPEAIQDMQIQSLETQTRLSIEYEEEKQKQSLLDFTLSRETKRSEEKMNLEKAQQDHSLTLKHNEEKAMRDQIDQNYKMENENQKRINDEMIRMKDDETKQLRERSENETRQIKERSTVLDLTAIEVARATAEPVEKRFEFINAPESAVKNELII